MVGTVVCAVRPESDEGADVIAVGAALSERLRLRLVLVAAVDGIDSGLGGGDGNESVSMKGVRESAERRLAQLAALHGVTDRAERRSGVGDPATMIAQVAAEEAADLIVVGARPRGWRKRLESRLALELEAASPVPVLIAPPRLRGVRDDTQALAESANVVT